MLDLNPELQHCVVHRRHYYLFFSVFMFLVLRFKLRSKQRNSFHINDDATANTALLNKDKGAIQHALVVVGRNFDSNLWVDCYHVFELF